MPRFLNFICQILFKQITIDEIPKDSRYYYILKPLPPPTPGSIPIPKMDKIQDGALYLMVQISFTPYRLS